MDPVVQFQDIKLTFNNCFNKWINFSVSDLVLVSENKRISTCPQVGKGSDV